LGNLVVPLFHCSPRGWCFSQEGQQWTSSYYLGIGALALALIAVVQVRRPLARFFAIVALGGLLLALGENGFLLGWIKQVCPAISLVRFPIKFVVLTVFAVPLLAAFGLDATQRMTETNRFTAHRTLIGIGLLLVLRSLSSFGSLSGILFPRKNGPPRLTVVRRGRSFSF
jgi:hypothetical protein